MSIPALGVMARVRRAPAASAGAWRAACGSDAAAAREAARAVLDARVRSGTAPFSLALSGGRIAPVLYAELVAQSRRRGVDLRDVDYFWADERCVAPEHSESNFHVAREALLGPLDVSFARVHRLEGEMNPAEAALRADRAWRAWRVWIPAEDMEGTGPSCVILGVGEDGHVASLFPGNLAADLAVATPFAAVVGPKPPPQRLTMTYRLLWQADLVVVLATGDGKAAVVEAALAGDTALPLTRVLAGRRSRSTQIFTR